MDDIETADALEKQAASLVDVAQVAAVGSFTRLSDDFSFLASVNVAHWDFIVTAAGIFIAATRLKNLGLERQRYARLMEIVAERVHTWDPRNGYRAFEDCKTFFNRTYDALTVAGSDPRFVSVDALGGWIVWNILDRPAEAEDECRLVRVVGTLVTHTFFDWWRAEVATH